MTIMTLCDHPENRVTLGQPSRIEHHLLSGEDEEVQDEPNARARNSFGFMSMAFLKGCLSKLFHFVA
jgi:hypothetical protein